MSECLGELLPQFEETVVLPWCWLVAEKDASAAILRLRRLWQRIFVLLKCPTEDFKILVIVSSLFFP